MTFQSSSYSLRVFSPVSSLALVDMLGRYQQFDLVPVGHVSYDWLPYIDMEKMSSAFLRPSARNRQNPSDHGSWRRVFVPSRSFRCDHIPMMVAVEHEFGEIAQRVLLSPDKSIRYYIASSISNVRRIFHVDFVDGAIVSFDSYPFSGLPSHLGVCIQHQHRREDQAVNNFQHSFHSN